MLWTTDLPQVTHENWSRFFFNFFFFFFFFTEFHHNVYLLFHSFFFFLGRLQRKSRNFLILKLISSKSEANNSRRKSIIVYLFTYLFIPLFIYLFIVFRFSWFQSLPHSILHVMHIYIFMEAITCADTLEYSSKKYIEIHIQMTTPHKLDDENPLYIYIYIYISWIFVIQFMLHSNGSRDNSFFFFIRTFYHYCVISHKVFLVHIRRDHLTSSRIKFTSIC